MTTINDINKEMQELLSEVEDEDVVVEVNERMIPFTANMNALLQTDTIEIFLEKYEDMNKENSAVLKCFNLDTTKELEYYVQKNELSFDDLKIETTQATCEALKFVIYDSEEEDEY
ncbi:hypothetical protein [Sulfurimonas sp.]|uniref:hypothetical protein n=1 Tax=Sulfurimonas sp. TaxID=2022749 RepID=UPI002AB2E76B|nr:hypothetical protein [Sulfurimonas sp.]